MTPRAPLRYNVGVSQRPNLLTCASLRLTLLLLLSLLLGSACSAPLVPTARMPDISRRQVPDANILLLLRQDWQALHQVKMPPAERQQLIARYNENLLLLLRRCRVDVLKASRNDTLYQPNGFTLETSSLYGDRPLREIYSDVVPAADVHTRDLEEHYTIPGIGVPLIGIIPADKADLSGQTFRIRTRGTVQTLTAVMEFPDAPSGTPRLRLIPRHRQENLRLGRLIYPLAADISAPMEIYWNLTRVKKDRWLGMLRPQELRDVTGLSCIEGYNPNRIPVILTHGLMSSAGTFDNLVNRLLNDPVIRDNFQFWYFNYPTGLSWTVTATAYRNALQDARQKLDPHHRNPNWDNLIVAGHSMGGLITHYSQCVEPWLLLQSTRPGREKWAPYLNERYIDSPLPEPGYEALRRDFFFRPVNAGLVIYMATPHRGAPMAHYRIVSFLMKLVHLPESLVTEVINIATLQENNVLINPKQLTEWFTSVNQLSPDSYSIRGLQPLAVRNAPTHSVIGDRGRHNSPRSSDGVVPYWSSHIPWGSETIVPSDHSVQDAPETADDLIVLLKAYLRTHPRRDVSPAW